MVEQSACIEAPVVRLQKTAAPGAVFGVLSTAPQHVGLPGVYSTIWCLCYKTNELKKKRGEEGNGPSQRGRPKGQHTEATRWGIKG